MSNSLPKRWSVEHLSDIAKVVMGQSPPSSTYNRDKNGLPFFQGKTEFGEISPTVEKYCSQPIKIAEKNDILMSVRAPVGPVNINPSKCCIGRGLSAIRTKEEKADYLYLYFYLKSIEHQLANSGQGSTFKAINKSQIEGIDVPLPNRIETQKKIAQILNKAFTLRLKKQQACQLANHLVQSVYLNFLGDPAINPKKWKIEPYGSLIKESRNGFGKRNKSGKQEGHIVLRIQDIQNGKIDTEDLNRIPMTESEFQKYQLIQNDLLFVRVNGNADLVGKVALFDINSKEIAFNDHIVRLRVVDYVEPLFLKCFLETNYARKEIKKLAVTSAGQFSVGQQRLSMLPVPLPPIERQRQFSLFVKKIESLKNNQHTTNEFSVQLWNTLLAKAFKGELVH